MEIIKQILFSPEERQNELPTFMKDAVLKASDKKRKDDKKWNKRTSEALRIIKHRHMSEYKDVLKVLREREELQ